MKSIREGQEKRKTCSSSHVIQPDVGLKRSRQQSIQQQLKLDCTSFEIAAKAPFTQVQCQESATEKATSIKKSYTANQTSDLKPALGELERKIASELGDYWNNLAPRKKSLPPVQEPIQKKLQRKQGGEELNTRGSAIESSHSDPSINESNDLAVASFIKTPVSSTDGLVLANCSSSSAFTTIPGDSCNLIEECTDFEVGVEHDLSAEMYTNHRYPLDHLRDDDGKIMRKYTSAELAATPEEGLNIHGQSIDSGGNDKLAVFNANGLTRNLCRWWDTSLLPSLEHICAISRSTFSDSSESSSSPSSSLYQTNDELIMIPNLEMDIPSDFGKRQPKKKSGARPCSLAIGTEGMLTFDSEKVLGSGGYGYVLKTSSFTVLLAKPTKYRRKYKSIAIKIGEEIGYLVWETLIHKRIQFRIETSLKQHYYYNFCPPIALLVYQNSSVMCMELGSLGSYISMINAVIEADNLTADETEFLAMYFSAQALKAINVLHAASIIHTDIKTDNWVLQGTDTDDIKLLLIDFGKAIDLKEIAMTTKSERIGLIGSTAVTDFECPEMINNMPWSFQADYFAVVACIHPLLYGESLKIRSVTAEVAQRKGYTCPVDVNEDCNSSKISPTIWIPTQTLKRYWNCSIWSKFYSELINASKLCEKKDLSELINMFDTTINSKQSEGLKTSSLRKLKGILLSKESRTSK